MAFLSFSATHSVEALDKTKNEVNRSCFHFILSGNCTIEFWHFSFFNLFGTK